MSDRYLGLMSGTSFDGIDAVVASFEDQRIQLYAHAYLPYESALTEELLQLSIPESKHTLESLYELDARLGECNAQAVQAVLKKADMLPTDIRAIGMHGQTIRHYPNHPTPFTVQLGDPNRVVAATGIPTACDVRRKDVALGGQGAPLAPLFHHAFFASRDEDRAVVNIGGFANVTLLQKDRVWGFDTGPGNIFLDAIARKQLHTAYDANGDHARKGRVDEASLKRLLMHPFFQQCPPKSTGRDTFTEAWLKTCTGSLEGQSAADWLATLIELTAMTIANSILQASPSTKTVFVCGGGAENAFLMERLQALLPAQRVKNTMELGLASQHTEACLMAWLARQRILEIPVDLRSITGSREVTILGGLYR